MKKNSDTEFVVLALVLFLLLIAVKEILGRERSGPLMALLSKTSK